MMKLKQNIKTFLIGNKIGFCESPKTYEKHIGKSADTCIIFENAKNSKYFINIFFYLSELNSNFVSTYLASLSKKLKSPGFFILYHEIY